MTAFGAGSETARKASSRTARSETNEMPFTVFQFEICLTFLVRILCVVLCTLTFNLDMLKKKHSIRVKKIYVFEKQLQLLQRNLRLF